MKRDTIREPFSRIELRERIIDIALGSFSTLGIRNVTMDDIAAKLSISKRTLYEMFADKETLLKECIIKVHHEADAYALGIYNKSSNVLEVLLKCYQHNIEQLHQTNRLFFEDIKKYPKVYEMLMKRHNRDSEHAISFLKKGVEQGLFRSDVNFAIVNMLVHEQLNLLMDTDLCKEFSFPEVYESIMFTCIRGISTERGASELEDFIRVYRRDREILKKMKP